MVEIYPQENLCDGDNEDESDNESSDNESCDEISFLDSSKAPKETLIPILLGLHMANSKMTINISSLHLF